MDIASRLIIPLITPFKRDYSIDREEFKSHLERLYREGVDAFFIASSTGEMDKLNIDEIGLLVEDVNDLDGDLDIYVGIYSSGSREALEKIKWLDERCEVDGYIIPTPPYFKYNDVELAMFYREILENVENQVIIYVIPSLTGLLPSPQLFTDLLDRHENLTGVKITYDDASYLESITRLVETYPGFKVYVGSDVLTLPNLLIGGYGLIPGLGNVYPEPYISLISSYLEGDLVEAVKWFRRILRMERVFEAPYKFPAIVKAALEILGLGIDRRVRPPMNPVDKSYDEYIRSIFQGV